MNKLNIKSFDSFLQKDSKIEIHPNCIRHTDDFKMKEKMLLVVNCDSDIFLHPMIRSLYKNVNQDDFTLCIFDNSYSAKFNEDIYFNYGFNNILFLDNTRCYTDAVPRRWIVDVGEKLLNTNRFASVIHCKTVDFCLKYFKQEGVKDLILADSDVLFKQNPFNIIDRNYVCVGENEAKNHRLAPYLLYFNLEKLELNYFDETRMLGITSDDLTLYDTGGAFTEDLIDKKLPYKQIKLEDYIEHFGGGSYIFDADDIKGTHNIICSRQEQPQKSFELVYKWLKLNYSLYL